MTEPTGALCYFEIPAPDLKKAREFYSAVFGWKLSGGIEGTEYAAFAAGSIEGGLNPKLKPSAEQGLNLVLKVEDIEATVAKIAASGGQVIQSKTEVGGGNGDFALFLDPNGNLLSLWARGA